MLEQQTDCNEERIITNKAVLNELGRLIAVVGMSYAFLYAGMHKLKQEYNRYYSSVTSLIKEDKKLASRNEISEIPVTCYDVQKTFSDPVLEKRASESLAKFRSSFFSGIGSYFVAALLYIIVVAWKLRNWAELNLGFYASKVLSFIKSGLSRVKIK